MTSAAGESGQPPYHELGRDARHRWWRPALEIVLVVVIFGTLYLVVALVATSFADPDRGPVAQLFWANLIGALLLPAVLLGVGFTGRRPGTVTGVARRIRWRWLGACAARGLVVTVPALLVWLLRSGGWQPELWPGLATWCAAAGAAVVLVPLSIAGAQYVNGWLLQVFGAWTGRAWLAVLLVAAVGLAVPSSDPLGKAAGVVVGLAMCWLMVRTGGLEAALGLMGVYGVVAELVAQSQSIPAVGPVEPAALLDELPFLLAVAGYTWWTARAAPRRPESIQALGAPRP